MHGNNLWKLFKKLCILGMLDFFILIILFLGHDINALMEDEWWMINSG